MEKLFLKFCFKHKNRAGFTLVETLVAVSIFSLSVLSMMLVLSGGLQRASYAKEKITAEYLAQEGIEYIRNMRDSYMLYGTTAQAGWDSFVSKMAPAPNTLCAGQYGCYFDDRNVSFLNNNMPIADLVFSSCASGTCAEVPLLYDGTTGKYNYVSGTPSGYTRQIIITEIGAPINEIKISSTVYWKQGSGSFNANASENLLNWIE